MTDLEKQIQEYVEKGLSGDMTSVNSIEDRILRGKVKAAIVKAKRLGVKKESSQLKKTDAKSWGKLKAKDLMNSNPLTAIESDNLQVAENRMRESKVQCLIVKNTKKQEQKI